jgi:hypothetical protein
VETRKCSRKRRRGRGRAMETRGLFWKNFAMVLLSFGKRREKGTEGNKDEKLENNRIFQI